MENGKWKMEDGRWKKKVENKLKIKGKINLNSKFFSKSDSKIP
jgi:hypothetical protein